MDTEAINELSVLIQLVQTGGVIALLFIAVYWFQSGKIISRPVLDKILEAYTAKVVEMFSEEFKNVRKEIRELREHRDRQGRW